VVAEDAGELLDVGQMRHVFERQRLVGEQAAIISGSAAFLAPEIGMRRSGACRPADGCSA
jgi:hypothetical protein